MKKVRITIVLILLAAFGSPMLAQSVGELNRFDDESLERINKVSLYPNPTIDFLKVEIANSDLKNVEFTVHDIIGNIVETSVEKISESEFKIDVESLPTGYYLVAIKDDQAHFRETYKFLKR